MTTAWPYELADYPPEYAEYMKAKYNEWALKAIQNDDITPQLAPVRIMNMGDGVVFTMAPNGKSKAERWIYIGKGYGEVFQQQDGTFNVTLDQYDQGMGVEEVLNWCSENIKNGWRFTAWDHVHAGMRETSYFVEITDHKELTHFLLRWKGNIK